MKTTQDNGNVIQGHLLKNQISRELISPEIRDFSWCETVFFKLMIWFGSGRQNLRPGEDFVTMNFEIDASSPHASERLIRISC